MDLNMTATIAQGYQWLGKMTLADIQYITESGAKQNLILKKAEFAKTARVWHVKGVIRRHQLK